MKQISKYVMFSIVFIVLVGYSSSILYGNRPINKESKAYQNAYQNLKVISKETHPTDSAYIEEVRDYIVSQFDDMGVPYQILNDGYKVSNWIEWNMDKYYDMSQEDKKWSEEEAASYGFSNFRDYITDVARFLYGGADAVIPMQNILVKIDGSGNKGVMLVSHYDSVDGSHGAGDDGAAVVSMIEAIRTASEIDASNDLYFLITEGEENHLWGSNAFVESHPEYKDLIDIVFNFEGRGANGAILLFETSKNNSGIIKETSKALGYATGYSFMNEVYHHMPNDTDLTEFMKKGYAGANFAFTGTVETYHLPSDNMENLSENTLYEMIMLQQDIVNYFSNSDLSKLTSNTNSVFLPIIKGKLLILPNNLMFLIAICAAALALAVIIIYVAKKEIKGKRLLLSFGIVLLLTGVILLITYLVGYQVSNHYKNLKNNIWSNGADYTGYIKAGKIQYIIFGIQVLLSFIITLVTITLVKRRFHIEKELLTLCLSLGAIASTVLAFFMNGASYLCSVPTLLTAVIQMIMWNNKIKKPKTASITAAFVILIVSVLIFAPFIETVYCALQISYIGFMAPILCVFRIIPLLQSIVWLEHRPYSSNISSSLGKRT